MNPHCHRDTRPDHGPAHRRGLHRSHGDRISCPAVQSRDRKATRAPIQPERRHM